jgi:hypothetical protein
MADEFVCDTPEIRSFIGEVKECIARGSTIQERLAAIRPYFDRLIANPDWLPQEFRRTLESGGMGSGIANWLLLRITPSCWRHSPGCHNQ